MIHLMASFFVLPLEILLRISENCSFKQFVKLFLTSKQMNLELIPNERFTKFIAEESDLMSQCRYNRPLMTRLSQSIVATVPPRLHFYKCEKGVIPSRLGSMISAVMKNDLTLVKFLLNFKLETNLFCSLSYVCKIVKTALNCYKENPTLVESCKKRFEIFIEECKDNLESDCSGSCVRKEILEYFDWHYYGKPKPKSGYSSCGDVDRMNGSGDFNYNCDDPLPLITLLIAQTDEMCSLVFGHISTLLNNTPKNWDPNCFVTKQPYYLLRQCVMCYDDGKYYKHAGLFENFVRRIDSFVGWENFVRCRIDPREHGKAYFKYETA